MITPKFSCSQTNETVLIKLYVPAIRASDIEIHVEGRLLVVHVNPYFLKLSFPGDVTEDDESSANYDPSNGYLIVTLSKEVKGQDFPDLDLLSKLLAPPKEAVGGGIEVLDPDVEGMVEAASSLRIQDPEIAEAISNDWQLPQIPSSENPFDLSTGRHYGFLDLYTGYFRHVAHVENDVNQLGANAETMSPAERLANREQKEEEKWDEEYYMQAADFVNDEEIVELVNWKADFQEHSSELSPLDEEETQAVLRLPRKEYLISPTQSTSLYLTLISLLFSYCYDSRTTQQDPNSESAWTISILTPSFAALDASPSSLSTVFRASYRRALAYPLYRSWLFCERCRHDVADIMAGGKRKVLRYLLKMKGILDHHEVYYIYSKIWMDDYCVWIQSYASDDVLLDFAKEVRSVAIPKSSIGWDLEALERAALSTRESDSDDESEDEIERMTPSVL
ncbi:SHQ1-domain-containing protein [Sistotremastrum suecicum HHB10207 ss-3]|uniref:SHQ1-domain-containing protein n=1 Tax=Sistotremastrum suecicum HHB10207 ss-3 TaxID=1314776 RepID=A0A166IWF5_9AGAM|nr:SHQ1-domain-containing protein [Sistotremastrum suecicum HHB10207 ss-3]